MRGDLENNQSDDFGDYKKLILNELQRMNEEIISGRKELRRMSEEIVTIRVKLSIQAAVWGALAGMIPVIILLAIKALSK